MARYQRRPQTLDYAKAIFTDFVVLHGDRTFGDDKAIVGGPARLDGQVVMIVGHQRGHDTKEAVERNHGQPHPEGFRKALRFFRLAEKFGMPLLTFLDSSGAYPGLEDEQRGQAWALADNIAALTELRVPIIASVIGEGGSGGSLAIGVADRLLMLEHSVFSVATPEAAASIVWKDSRHAPEAAEALKLTAPDLLELNVADRIVPEPPGGPTPTRPPRQRPCGRLCWTSWGRCGRYPWSACSPSATRSTAVSAPSTSEGAGLELALGLEHGQGLVESVDRLGHITQLVRHGDDHPSGKVHPSQLHRRAQEVEEPLFLPRASSGRG